MVMHISNCIILVRNRRDPSSKAAWSQLLDGVGIHVATDGVVGDFWRNILEKTKSCFCKGLIVVDVHALGLVFPG